MTGRYSSVKAWPPTVWILLGGQFLIRAAGFAYPFLTYQLHGIGYGPSAAGWVLTAFGAGWCTGQLACGWLTDRLGARGTLAVSMLIAACALPVLGLAHGLPALSAAAIVSGSVYSSPRPIVGAAIAHLLPRDGDRTAANGWRHWSTNVGAALTGACGGYLASWTGTAVLFWINAAACGAFAVVALRFVPPLVVSQANQAHNGYRRTIADTRLWLLLLASIGALIPIMGTNSALPMMMASDGLPISAFGAVECANALTVMVLTVAMNPWLSRRASAGNPMVGTVATSSVLLGTAMGAAALAHSTVAYAAAVVLSIPGEIAFVISASDVLNRIAPAEQRGRYHGAWEMSAALAATTAPLLASWSLTHGGRPMVAATTAVAGLLGAACCIPLLQTTRRHPHPALPAIAQRAA